MHLQGSRCGGLRPLPIPIPPWTNLYPHLPMSKKPEAPRTQGTSRFLLHPIVCLTSSSQWLPFTSIWMVTPTSPPPHHVTHTQVLAERALLGALSCPEPRAVPHLSSPCLTYGHTQHVVWSLFNVPFPKKRLNKPLGLFLPMLIAVPQHPLLSICYMHLN